MAQSVEKPEMLEPKKHLTQQVFNKALFSPRPRSQSQTANTATTPIQYIANIETTNTNTNENSPNPDESNEGFKMVTSSKKGNVIAQMNKEAKNKPNLTTIG